MPPNEDNLCIRQSVCLIFEHIREMSLQGTNRHGVRALIVIAKIVKLYAAKIKRFTYIVFILEIVQELLVIYLPSQTLFAAVKQIGGINERIASHRHIVAVVCTYIANAGQR